MQYYKEVEVSSWRGIVTIFLLLALIFMVFAVPRFTAIKSYNYTTVKTTNPTPIPLNNNTTSTTGDFILDNGEIYSTSHISSGYAQINESLNESEGLTFNYTIIKIGTFSSFELMLYNESNRVQVLDIQITTSTYGEGTILNINVNGYNYQSQDINLDRFSKNPVISIYKLHDSYIFSFGYLQYNITRDTLEHGIGVGTINATTVYLSGNLFYYYALNGVSKQNIIIEEHHYPLVKNWLYIALAVIVSAIGVLGVYLYRGKYIELILLTLLGIIPLIDFGLYLTATVSYLVNITVAMFGLSLTVLGVNIEQYEDIDLFLEKHMWKFTVIWVALLLIYFLL